MHGHCERHLSREVFALDHDEIGFNAVESLLTFDSGIKAMALSLCTRCRVRLYSEQMHGISAEASAYASSATCGSKLDLCIGSRRHSGNSVDCPRSAPSTKRFMNCRRQIASEPWRCARCTACRTPGSGTGDSPGPRAPAAPPRRRSRRPHSPSPVPARWSRTPTSGTRASQTGCWREP
jgi:hypothetical protein